MSSKMVAGKKAKQQYQGQTEFLIIFYQKIRSMVAKNLPELVENRISNPNSPGKARRKTAPTQLIKRMSINWFPRSCSSKQRFFGKDHCAFHGVLAFKF